MFKRVMLGVLLAVVFSGKESEAGEQNDSKKVRISQVVVHPALNKTAEGIQAALKEKGYKEGETLDLQIEIAQANPALAAQISSKFLAQEPDVVVGIGTISAQSFLKGTTEGKSRLIFSSVTDPEGAGLTQSGKGGKPVALSGVSNFVPLEPQLKLFQELQPSLKTLGILYNPGEANSVSIVQKLKEIAPRMGLTLVEQTIMKTADVAQGAVNLAGKADAIFISNDNTALSSLQSVIRAAHNAKIPVYVSDTDAVELGALAALGPNQYAVGLQTGKMVVRVLEGEDPSRIAIEFPAETELFINKETADLLGISLSPALLEKAHKIIKKSAS